MPWKVVPEGGKHMVYKLGPDGRPVGKPVGMHATAEEALAHMRALYVNMPAGESTSPARGGLMEREVSAEERRAMAAKGQAMPDGSYFIVTPEDLSNAIQAFGRAPNPEATKAHIKKRAAALGLTSHLPDSWKESAVRTIYFAESADLRESDLDETNFIARGVTLIRPGFSSNADKAGRRRYYPRTTLAAAAPVFEGTRAFRNHPRKSDEKDLPERDVRDLTGYYRNVHAGDDGRLVADFHVVGEARQWLWPLVAETKQKPDLVELSINALGQTRLDQAEGESAVVVESIVKANSVDVVTTGAAGGSFAGALLAADPDGWTRDLLGAMTFEEWREARPEFFDKLKAEWKTLRETEALRDGKMKIDELTQQLVDLKEATRAMEADLGTFRRAEIADRLLSSSGLPLNLRGAVREQLLECADDVEMQVVLEREKAKFSTAPKPSVPVSGAGQRMSTPPSVSEPARINPIAEAFGVDLSQGPLPGETAEAYKARRLRERRS